MMTHERIRRPMLIKDFIQNIQQRMHRLRASARQSTHGRLRVLNLEDRRLLDATAGFVGGQLILDAFDAGEAFEVTSHADGHLDFTLTDKIWQPVSDSGLSIVDAGKTLRLDEGSVASLNNLNVNSAAVELNNVTLTAALSLDSLQIVGGGNVELSSLMVTNDVSISADQISDTAGSTINVNGLASLTADSIILGDDATTNFGSVTFTSDGDVSISEDSSMDIAGAISGATIDLTADGDITTVPGATLTAEALTLSATDVIYVNGPVAVDGDLEFTASSIHVNAATVTSGSSQTYNGDVLLDRSVVFTASDGIDFQGKLDSSIGGNFSATINADVVFDANVGSTSPLSALIVNGTASVDGNVTTSAQQTFNGAVTLTEDAVFESTTSGNLKFSDTVDGPFSFTANTAGTTQFLGAVGGTAPLMSVATDADGATTVSGGAITTSGIQDYQDSVVFTENTTLTASSVTFAGGVGGGNNDLIVVGDLSLQSNAAGLKSIDVKGKSILNGNITTTARQDFGDSVVLQSDVNLTGNGITFTDTMNGEFLLTVDGGTGDLVFNKAVGGTEKLSGLVASGNNVMFTEAVTVDDEGLDVTSISTMNFVEGVTTCSDGTVVLDNGGELTLANGKSFDLDGAFAQTGAGTVTTGTNIQTTGDSIVFASALSQTAAVVLKTTAASHSAGANVTLRNVDSTDKNLTIDAGESGMLSGQQLTNGGVLTVTNSGSTTFEDSVVADAVFIADTTNSVTFEGDVTASDLTTTGEGYSVSLLEDTTVTNTVTFLNTGGITLGDSVGDIQTFSGGLTSSISTNTVQGTIQTSGNDLVLGQTVLANTTTLSTDTVGGDITVGKITGAGTELTVNAGTGDITMTNAENVIGDLQVTANQATIVEADNVTQSSAWTVTDSLNLSAAGHDILLTNTANTFGSINLTADNVQVTENEDMAVESVTATDSVYLTATGSIEDHTADDAIDISAQTLQLTAGSGIGNTAPLELDVDTLTASVTGTGDINVVESDGLTITSLITQNGSISVTASGDVELGTVTANSIDPATHDVTLTTTGDIIDSNGAAGNITAADGLVALTAHNVGTAGSEVFKPTATADAIEITASELSVTATGTDPDGIVAVHLSSDTSVKKLDGNHVFLTSNSNVDLSEATPTANSLSIIADGQITLPTELTVQDDLVLKGSQIQTVVGSGTPIDLNATRILLESGSSLEASVTAEQIDVTTVGDLLLESDSASLQLTDLDCSLWAINTNGSIAVIDQTGGIVTQQLPADSTQNSRILSDKLLLEGTGTFELTNSDNNVNTLAAATAAAVSFADTDGLTIGSINSVDGITTGGNLLLDVGGTLQIEQGINSGTADVRITTGSGTAGAGGIQQSATGAIVAGQLGIRNVGTSGNLILAAMNDVNVFAAENSASGGSVAFQDLDDVKIASVSLQSVPDAEFLATEGITTNNGDVTIASGLPATGPDSLLISNSITAGTGTVRLMADGNVSQSPDGTIHAGTLGVRQIGTSGDIVLDDDNVISVFAAYNFAAGGTIGLKNLQDLTVGNVSAQDVAANPTSMAIHFDPTVGIMTNNGTIQLLVDGPDDVDGNILLQSSVAAGDAGVGITSDGNVIQAVTAAIRATDLVVHQTNQLSESDIRLGVARNDVENVALRNVSEGGDILFNDISDLTVSEVSLADVGNLTIATTTGIDADAGNVNVTSTGDMNVDENINAASDHSTSSVDETITLISREGNFTLADGTVISTDENPAAGIFEDTTGDQIHILAGTDGGTGTVNLGDPATIEIRTDGGVAKQIAPRPSAFTTSPTTGSETAFVTLTDAANSRNNLTFEEGGFLGELEYIFGIVGEENLEVVVDWGVISETDPTASGVAGNATARPEGGFEFDDSDRDKSIFFIDEGGQKYEIAHVYDLFDLVTTSNDRNGRQINPNIIGVRLSVAQHESINIWGTGAADPTAPGTVATAAAFTGSAGSLVDASGNSITPTASGLSLLSSTDTNNLRNQTAEASSEFPLLNQVVTPTGKPQGLAEWEFIAGPSPGVVPFEPTERFVANTPDVVAPVEAAPISEISGDAFFGDGAASEAGIGTDVYLQIRRYFELDADAEVVIARIQDSDLLTSRTVFEEFVAQNPELQDGAGYEIWLITETGGQRVERPVVEFEITGGRPGPAMESLEDAGQTETLVDVPFEQTQTDEPSKENQSNTKKGNSADASGEPSGEEPAVRPELKLEEDPQAQVDPAANAGMNQPKILAGVRLDSHHAAGATGGVGQAGTDQADADAELDSNDSGGTGITESSGTAVGAVAAFSAVHRFRSESKRSQSAVSRTSRTMRSLRNPSEPSAPLSVDDF